MALRPKTLNYMKTTKHGESQNDQAAVSQSQSPPCCASLSERQEAPDKFDMPTWGRSFSAGELITTLLQREGSREEALDTLSQTLADLGISGEEVAHYQRQPGICHDCAETDAAVTRIWSDQRRKFSSAPIEMHKSYLKADVLHNVKSGGAPR